MRIPRNAHPRGTAMPQPLVVVAIDVFHSWPVAMNEKQPNIGATVNQLSKNGPAVLATATTSNDPSTGLWDALPTAAKTTIMVASNTANIGRSNGDEGIVVLLSPSTLVDGSFRSLSRRFVAAREIEEKILSGLFGMLGVDSTMERSFVVLAKSNIFCLLLLLLLLPFLDKSSIPMYRREFMKRPAWARVVAWSILLLLLKKAQARGDLIPAINDNSITKIRTSNMISFCQ